MNANPPDPWVLIGRIGKAHGLDGSVRVWPEAQLGEIFDNQVPLKLWFPNRDLERDLTPISIREVGGVWTVRWEGVFSREAAQSIRNGWIVARRQDLPPPAEDCVYWNDLLGSAVETKNRERVGVVVDIIEAPSQTLVEIERDCGGRFLLPLSEEVDAEFQRAAAQGDSNRLAVRLPEGMVEATTIEVSDRPRRRDRRRGQGKTPRDRTGD